MAASLIDLNRRIDAARSCDADTLQLDALWPIRRCYDRNGREGWAVHAHSAHSGVMQAGVWRATEMEARKDRDAVIDAFIGEVA